MIFSFTDADFLDSKKVKVVYGVAGRGKSSVINNFLQSNSIAYTWTTSTNKLKRDAAERYGCEAKTVCSALFTSDAGRFYIDEKDPDAKTIIIDEILQTSVKVLDWIRHHKDVYNIIVLTDTHQMLAVDNNKNSFLKAFNDFLKEPFVISDEGTETQRARDAETKATIEYLYTQSDERSTEFVKALKSHRYNVIRYEDMQFSTNDIYITHLNETEDMLYRDKNFAGTAFAESDLVAKGSIASRPPKDFTKYPILSQLQAERLKSQAYYQLKNVGSCTRYQGSECTTSQTLYYIITPDSRVTNREWYTVVSRCWSIDSITIVVADKEVKTKLSNFAGKKVKDMRTLVIL